MVHEAYRELAELIIFADTRAGSQLCLSLRYLSGSAGGIG